MKKRILIVDDDEDILYVLQEVLEYEGFGNSGVRNTTDLFKLVRDYQPALILLDYRLDGVDGGAWCNRLKSNPEFAHIPVILFSAYANKGLAKGIFGCNDFIPKPFDLDDLITRIRLLIEPNSQPRVVYSNN